MPTAVGTILRAASRLDCKPLNVLSFSTHEAFQTSLAHTDHNFFLVQGPGIKTWNAAFRPLPKNHTLLDGSRGPRQIPADIDFDLVLSQNKFGQFGVAKQLCRQLHLPMVSLEHTLPAEGWSAAKVKKMREMHGDIDVYISAYSRGRWGGGESAAVIHHGIETGLFEPGREERRAHALSVVNEWQNRDWCCGFNLWQEATRGMPTRVVGDNPGLSKPAPSVAALVREYQSSLVFLNTSLVSPVPTALLEAMSCGCAVASTATCMIPEIIKDGENGLLADTADGLRAAVRRLLGDPGLAARLGAAARRTVLEKFGLGRFVREWDALLRRASEIIYAGEKS